MTNNFSHCPKFLLQYIHNHTSLINTKMILYQVFQKAASRVILTCANIHEIHNHQIIRCIPPYTFTTWSERVEQWRCLSPNEKLTQLTRPCPSSATFHEAGKKISQNSMYSETTGWKSPLYTFKFHPSPPQGTLEETKFFRITLGISRNNHHHLSFIDRELKC